MSPPLCFYIKLEEASRAFQAFPPTLHFYASTLVLVC